MTIWKEMSRFRRGMMLLMAAMILCFCVLTVVSITREGTQYRDGFLRYTQEGDAAIYTGKVEGKPAQWTVTGDTAVYQWGGYTYGPYQVDTSPDQTISSAIDGRYQPVTIRQGDKVIFRGGCSASRLVDQDGEYLHGMSTIATTTDGQTYLNGKPVSSRELNEPGVQTVFLMVTGPGLTHRASFGVYLLVTLMAGLNILSILFPDFFFRWNFRFSVRNYEDMEPSDLALALRPVGWVVLAAVTLGLYWFNLTLIV